MKRKGRELPADKHENVPQEAKWLSGQGEGTWFVITKEEDFLPEEYRVRRISPQGNLDCDRVFEQENKLANIDLSKDWDIAHVSHCAIVRIKQNDTIQVLNFKREFKP